MKSPTYSIEEIFEIVRLIPAGRVSSYGAIAAALNLGSARIVGWAMNQSHFSETYVPAHRVVNRIGELSGRHHFSPPSLMQELLEKEGVLIKNSRVQDFDTVFWNPLTEI